MHHGAAHNKETGPPTTGCSFKCELYSQGPEPHTIHSEDAPIAQDQNAQHVQGEAYSDGNLHGAVSNDVHSMQLLFSVFLCNL
jgi:hypothetical protein